ncbi:MAG: helix-turn-helix domain-containing protein [Eubacteriales bacterium]|nr:helix-turn-helix domain-containing protein [Bacillota bacterium]MDP3050983.1 helix-turn-helix domain-containing protein [Eubacteriales bacterium]MDQ7792753.1 helix-turn-helix domain-containing protein [Clostridia bacterium]MDZ4042110.1 helix-turn-helix domain-containing protein [Eubacteriales bacterium]
MIQYREILRLHSQGVTQRGIAAACQCGRVTIRTLIERAEKRGDPGLQPVLLCGSLPLHGSGELG